MFFFVTFLACVSYVSSEIVPFTLPYEVIERNIITNVSVGTPPQEFKVYVDVHDRALFLFSEECEFCKTNLSMKLFDPKASTTFKDDSMETAFDSYSVGQLKLSQSHDEVKINGESIGSTQFGLAKTSSYFFNNPTKNFDGFLGLAFVFRNANGRGYKNIDNKIMSVYQESLEKTKVKKGLITYGKQNEKNCQKEGITFPDVYPYQLTFDTSSGSVGSVSLDYFYVVAKPNLNTTIVPNWVYKKIAAEFNAKQEENRLVVPCDPTEKFFSFKNEADVELKIPARILYSKEEDKCYLNVECGTYGAKIIQFSNNFFNHFCVTHDFDNSEVLISKTMKSETM